MKKMLLAFAIIACLLSVSNAQERISGQDVYTENEYTVQKGDTLWYLEGLQRGDSTQWRRLVVFLVFGCFGFIHGRCRAHFLPHVIARKTKKLCDLRGTCGSRRDFA